MIVTGSEVNGDPGVGALVSHVINDPSKTPFVEVSQTLVPISTRLLLAVESKPNPLM
jgi:hypothetical protein